VFKDDGKRFQQISWKTLWLVTWLSVLVYTALEWLFIVTKPSPFTAISWEEKGRIGLFTFALLALLSYAVLKLLQGLAALTKQTWLIALAGLLPAGIQAALAFLLIDNFTYTLFKVGVVTSVGWGRALYLGLFIVLLIAMDHEVSQQVTRLESRTSRHGKWLEPLLALWVVGAALVTYHPPMGADSAFALSQAAQGKRLPHIILLTPDGVNANHLSLYGYERDTTPVLRELAAYSLVGENHYSNCTNTIGGLISILSSKYPSTTRVFFPPELLRGKNAYEHLPGVLKAYGYTGYHFTHPYYADVTERNLLNGFDYVNGISLNLQQSPVKNFLLRLFDFDSANFLYEIGNRLADRLQHITFIKPMVNYQTLNPNETTGSKESPGYLSDAEKLSQALDILRTAQSPVFIHIHWMNTHPVYPKDSVPVFLPEEQVFSAGKDINAQSAFDMDFYDDTIYGFDKAVGQLITALQAAGLYDNTILIVTSDHGFRSNNLLRIPLIMHFPQDAVVERIRTNTQAIDIAPTILDYLGIPIPAWMEGRSLLAPEISQTEADRPVITVGINSKMVEQVEWGKLVVSEGEPPFYALGTVSLISCNTAYVLAVNPPGWRTYPIPDSTLSCKPISPDEAYQGLIEHLQAKGYDTSSLTGLDLSGGQ